MTPQRSQSAPWLCLRGGTRIEHRQRKRALPTPLPDRSKQRTALFRSIRSDVAADGEPPDAAPTLGAVEGANRARTALHRTSATSMLMTQQGQLQDQAWQLSAGKSTGLHCIAEIKLLLASNVQDLVCTKYEQGVQHLVGLVERDSCMSKLPAQLRCKRAHSSKLIDDGLHCGP